MQQFETPEPVDLTVRNRSGWIEITAHDAPTTTVDLVALTPDSEDLVQGTRVEATAVEGSQRVLVEVPEDSGGVRWLARGSGVGFRWNSRGYGVGVRIQVPPASRLHIQAASADVRAEGRYGKSRLHTASGDVSLDMVAGNAELETSSGEVRVEQVDGALRAYTASGDIQIGRVGGTLHLRSASGSQTVARVDGSAECESASGDIHVGQAHGTFMARAASGDIVVRESHDALQLQSQSGDLEVRWLQQGQASLQSISGDILVGIAAGSRVAVNARTRSGDVESEIPLSELPAGDDTGPLVDLRAHAISGDVRIVRAHRAASAV